MKTFLNFLLEQKMTRVIMIGGPGSGKSTYSEKTDIQFQLSTNSGTHEMNVFGEGILVDVPRTMQV